MKDSNNHDIHVQIENMFENMDKLFSSLGMEEKSRPVYSGQIMYMIEAMVNKGAVFTNIELLNRKLKDAVKKSEEIRIRQWASNVSECQNGGMQEAAEKLKTQDAELAATAAEERQKAEELALQLKSAQEALASQEKNSRNKNLEQIKLLISFRDSILMKLDIAKDQGEPSIITLFSSLSRETANMLEKCGVTILEGKGHYDSSMHFVTETKQTGDPALKDEIAEVFRPGYIVDGEMIRPEEVVLYSYQA